MNRIKMFVFALCAIFISVSASAATVNIVPGQSVGRDDFGYFSGLATIQINGGEELIAMNDSLDFALISSLWYTSTTSWQADFYTRDDILAGAPVRLPAEYYSIASQAFIIAIPGFTSADPHWAASGNEWVWDIIENGVLSANGWMPYSNMEYEPNIYLIDVYNNILSGIIPGYDYSNFMGVLVDPFFPERELLVLTNSISTPIPPAIWLFGTGLLGLAGIARRQSKQNSKK